MSNYAAAFSMRYGLTLGLTAMEGRGFSNPVDLAISGDDRLYVLSRTNPVQTEGIRVGILNLDSDYFGDFGSYGSGDGQFVWPTALAFDSQDRLYLADEHNQRITVFDKSGRYLSSWGVEGTADGEMRGPSGLAFDAEDGLYVVDHLNHRVQKFTTGGDWLLSWGREGDAEGEFNLPWGITVGPDGSVYVADWRNDRVQKFTADGRFMAVFGATGGGEGQLSRPAGVAVDPCGRVYVADWGNERVQVFDATGALLQSLRGEATLSKWGEAFMEANRDQAEARAGADLNPPLAEDVDTPYEESARIEHYFWGPVSVKLDREGRLYVIEANRHRVQVYLPATDC